MESLWQQKNAVLAALMPVNEVNACSERREGPLKNWIPRYAQNASRILLVEAYELQTSQ